MIDVSNLTQDILNNRLYKDIKNLNINLSHSCYFKYDDFICWMLFIGGSAFKYIFYNLDGNIIDKIPMTYVEFANRAKDIYYHKTGNKTIILQL